jgi:hypothetical protein
MLCGAAAAVSLALRVMSARVAVVLLIATEVATTLYGLIVP